MGIFPSKAKVTAQSPWQTMKVFIRNSTPSLVNVCKSTERLNQPWYHQVYSTLEKKIHSPASVHYTFQISTMFHKTGQITFSKQPRSQLTGLPRKFLKKRTPENCTRIHPYTQKYLAYMFNTFRRSAYTGCQCKPKPAKSSFNKNCKYYNHLSLLEQQIETYHN